MNHLTVDLTHAHRAMRMEEAAAYRRSAAVQPPRGASRRFAVRALFRRAERRAPATVSA